MIHEFKYSGDFTPMFKNRLNGGKVFDGHSHMLISLERAAEEMPRKFKGNVSIDAYLYLPFPDGMGKVRQAERENHYYRNSPTLAAMMRAVEGLCGDLLFDTDTVIVAIKMEKRWSMDPRLTMVISELGIYGKKDEEEEVKHSAPRESRR